MSKKITLNYNDTEYTLEYTRESVKTLEQGGFQMTRFLEMSSPYSDTLTLFGGAFIAHHSGVKLSTIEDIFKAQKCKKKLIQVLVEMFNEPFNALMDDPEGDKGNPTWSVAG